MSVEVQQWSPLSPSQARLHCAGIIDASELTFGKGAQQVDVGIQNNMTTTLHIGDELYDELLWPDASANSTNTSSIVIANDMLSHVYPLAFARVADPEPESAVLTVEGVALNVGVHNEQNLYGCISVLNHEAGSLEDNRLRVGAQFLIRAMLRAEQPPRQPLDPAAIIGRMGVNATISRRLLRSLHTFRNNVMIAGELGEPGSRSSGVYKKADAMLHTVVDDLTETPHPGSKILVANGEAYGALFDSRSHGLVVIRRVRTYPHTIVLTLAERPVENHSVVKQYYIQERGVFVSGGFLEADTYNPERLLATASELDAAFTEDPKYRNNLADDVIKKLRGDIHRLESQYIDEAV